MKVCVLCGREGRNNFSLEAGGWCCNSRGLMVCLRRQGLAPPYRWAGKRMPGYVHNEARDAAGVIATIVDRETGETFVRHEPGLVKAALAAILDQFDPGEYALRAVCTPRTILADLRGRRRAMKLPTPEEALLGAIGRSEFLEARL